MRKTLICSLVVLALSAGVARFAQATEVGYSRTAGMGLVLGDPTGLTGKLWLGKTNALDAGLGFWGYGVNDPCWTDSSGVRHCDRFGSSNGTLNIDYLWQSNIVRGTAQLDWHIGGGGRFSWWGNCQGDCVSVAARGPVGLDLMFQNPNFLEVFFELALALQVVPGPSLFPEGALGVRAYW
jgi:hypothetical protein